MSRLPALHTRDLLGSIEISLVASIQVVITIYVLLVDECSVMPRGVTALVARK